LGWIVHRDIQSQEILKFGKKINALGPMWASTMAQDFGLSGTLTVEQIYIQLETNDAEGGVVFSYPPVLGAYTYLADSLKKKPTMISELYSVCKKTEEAVVNYAGFDIAR
jgi:hypothetical protein